MTFPLKTIVNIKYKMLIATHTEWEAAVILTSLKNDNLVLIKDINKYGRIISSGHGFYTVKYVDSDGDEVIVKRMRDNIIKS